MVTSILFGSSTKNMINKIRNAKTSDEEKAVIARELEVIRTGLKNTQPIEDKKSYIRKMIFLHLHRVRTDFGQLGCLGLAGSSKYVCKRLGYLAGSILINKESEVFTLSMNVVLRDIQSDKTEYVIESLIFLGFYDSEDLLLNVSDDIYKHIESSNIIVVKRAALCAAKLVKMDSEHSEAFFIPCIQLIHSSDSKRIFNGLALFLSLCKNTPEMIDGFRSETKRLCEMLKNILEKKQCFDCDVFLTIRLIRVLAVLGKGCEKSSKEVWEVLGIVATKTRDKSTGSISTLYETVMAIMKIEPNYSLITLAMNILGRLLQSHDGMTRYVSLNMFEKTITKTKNRQISSIQRHRETIIKCLKDKDPIIRRKAISIIITLVDKDNLSKVSDSIFGFFKEEKDKFILSEYANQFFVAIDQNSPNDGWFIDSVMRLIILSGEYLKDNVLSRFISIAVKKESLIKTVIYQIFKTFTGDENDFFVFMSFWFIGMFPIMMSDLWEMENEELSMIEFLTGVVEGRSERIKFFYITGLSRIGCQIEKYRYEAIEALKEMYADEEITIQQKVFEYLTIVESGSYEILLRDIKEDILD
eukprot:GHVP01010535.1.p1 GENE.GHVP01010535.1~~GHVP01010535.1.p1  ORF type:complete len:585 (+),score=92.10 GHVP01010535.1:879-2633(+)